MGARERHPPSGPAGSTAGPVPPSPPPPTYPGCSPRPAAWLAPSSPWCAQDDAASLRPPASTRTTPRWPLQSRRPPDANGQHATCLGIEVALDEPEPARYCQDVELDAGEAVGHRRAPRDCPGMLGAATAAEPGPSASSGCCGSGRSDRLTPRG